jgi:hypothetical protein
MPYGRLKGTKMSPETLTPSKTKTRRLTGRAKSLRKSPKTATKTQAPAITDLKDTVQASVADIVAQVLAIGLDGDAAAPAEQIGEPVRPAKAKKSAPKAEKAATKADAKADTLLALLTRPEGTTVREMLTTTGWSHDGLKRHNTAVVRKELGFKFLIQRNPDVDPTDRKLTSYLYRASK